MTKRNVIWVASYPKSGNTWVSSMLRTAGAKYGFPQVSMDVYEMVKRGDAPAECRAVKERFQSNPCSVLKTHSVYKPEGQPHKFDGIDLETVGFVHIYRNPLDVLLSYISYTRIEYKANADKPHYRKLLFVDTLGFDEPIDYPQWVTMGLDQIPQKNLDHALNKFSEDSLSIRTIAPMAGSWIENTQSWINALEHLPGYSIRYEECLRDPEQMTQLADLFVFGRDVAADALELENNRARQMSESTDPYQSIFFNKLSSYYFSQYFSEEAIRKFCTENEETLRKFGYQSILDSLTP